MNPTALLALLADLYERVASESARADREAARADAAEARLAEHQCAEPPTKPEGQPQA